MAFRVRGVRGEIFALLTLAVTFVLATIVGNTAIDGGPGVYLNAVPVPRLGPTPTSSLYLLMLAAAVLTLLVSWAIRHSRFGAGLFAIHDDEDAAEVMGVPTYRWKLAALAVSCALAGLAGGIHALFVSYVTAAKPSTITVPLTVVLMSMLGGTRHWAGPAIGAVAITCLLFAFTGGEYAVLGKGADRPDPDHRDPVHARRHPGRACSGFARSVAARRRSSARAAADRCASRERRQPMRDGAGEVAAARAAACASPSRASRRSPASSSKCAAARSSACSGRTARASRPSSTS